MLQLLQHGNRSVRQKNYMPDYFAGNAEAAWKRTEPQTEFIRMASGQHQTIRCDRPIELTEAQEAEARQDPHVQQWLQRWQKHKATVVERYDTFENGRGSHCQRVAVR
jgi:hypothetical protein